MTRTDPSSHDENPDVPSSPAARPPLRRARILIVDDHPVVRSGLAELLRQTQDLELCGEAANEAEAFEQLRRVHPDLALVDLSLLTGNGIDLIKSIRQRHPEVRLVALSVHEESLYAERALRAGARGYLMKHEATSAILTAIQRVLNGGVYVSPAMEMIMLRKIAGDTKAGERTPMDTLSDRELEVFVLLGSGLGTRTIAKRLKLSVKTVEAHRAHIKQKTGVHSTSKLVRLAVWWVETKRPPRSQS